MVPRCSVAASVTNADGDYFNFHSGEQPRIQSRAPTGHNGAAEATATEVTTNNALKLEKTTDWLHLVIAAGILLPDLVKFIIVNKV